MLDALRNFVRRLGEPEPARRFDADDMRLALAALLVHAMAVDAVVSETERGKLRDLLGRQLGIAGQDLEALIVEAQAADEQAVDLYGFTRIIKRQMSAEERVRVVDDLWEIAFADGSSHEFEENLIWRVAELLGVSREDRIASRRAVAKNKSAGEEDTG